MCCSGYLQCALLCAILEISSAPFRCAILDICSGTSAFGVLDITSVPFSILLWISVACLLLCYSGYLQCALDLLRAFLYIISVPFGVLIWIL